MSDNTKEISGTVKIDTTQSREWAQELTLKKLLDAINLQTAAKGLANNLDAKAIKAFSDQLESATSVVGDYKKAEVEASNAATEKLRVDTQLIRQSKERKRLEEEIAESNNKYGSAVRDLRRSMSGVTVAFGDQKAAGAALGNAVTSVSNSFGDVITKTGKAGAAFALALGVATEVVKNLVGLIVSTMSTYSNIFQSGISFGGSLTEFGKKVSETGLTISQFGSIVERHGSAVFATGETRFLTSVGKLGSTFAKFGMNIEQGTEAFAEYTDGLRLNGSLYFMTEKQQREAFEKSITQQTALQTLTGVSIKRQRDEQKKLAEKASYQLLTAGMSESELAQVNQSRFTMAGSGMDADTMDSLLLYAKTGIAGTQTQTLLTLDPASVNSLAQGINSGNQEAQIAAIAGLQDTAARKASTESGSLAALATSGIGRGRGQEQALLIARLNEARRLRLLSPDQKRKEEQAAAIGQGRSPLGAQTEDIFKANNDLAVITGKANAQLFQLAEQAKSVTAGFARITSAIAGSPTASTIATGALGASGLIGSAVSGVLGLYTVRKLSQTAAALGQMPTVPGMGGSALGAAPVVPGMGGAAGMAGMASMAGTAAKLAKIGSVTGLVAGAAGMVLEKVAPEFVKTTAGSAIEGALSGAGLGATIGLIGGPLGSAIGAGLGAIGGGIYGYLSAPDGTAAPSAVPAGAPDPAGATVDISAKWATMNGFLQSIEANTAYTAALLEQGHRLSETQHRRLVNSIGEIS
jgi:hypothetical protein